MILIDNRNVLRMKNRELLNRLAEIDNNEPTGNVIVEPAKTGIPTLKIAFDGRTQYLHSKYDPEKDAERFVDKYINETYKHVLFVGTGLGYHISKFLRTHPDTKFSIYEPNEEVLHAYLANAKLNALPLHNLGRIFTGTNESDITNELQRLLQSSNGVLQIIMLPVYEKIYGAQMGTIMESVLESLKAKKSSLATNVTFQKRWTINSIKNFPTVIKTPNILHDIDKNAFEGKPAIIVAAGPSLNEEFENLRYIKDNGLAYIFSVGSAINALIEHDIHPDAACTYDPQDINKRVIQVIKDKEIKDIALIFGSSVGFETLEAYPGEMLHTIVSQDTVAPILLRHNQSNKLDYVNDAPSIAIVTFQVLSKLGFNKVILVGQNLAYIGNKHYAKGIDYGNGSNEITDESLAATLITKDVHGKEARTTEGFNSMRQQLEMYIAQCPHVEVVNTTVGGAAIQGTEYKPLLEIINQQLTEDVVTPEWASGGNNYDHHHLIERLNTLSLEVKSLERSLGNAFSTLEKIDIDVKLRKVVHLENSYIHLDKEINRVKNNQFYKSFIEPMIRVQNERLIQEIQSVRFNKNLQKKGETIVKEYLLFMTECSRHYHFSSSLYDEMKERIVELN